jgi:SET domain-containing protein
MNHFVSTNLNWSSSDSADIISLQQVTQKSLSLTSFWSKLILSVSYSLLHSTQTLSNKNKKQTRLLSVMIYILRDSIDQRSLGN